MSKVALHEYLNDIQHLLDEEMYDEAAGHCRFILHQHPRHVDTYRLLGQALLEQDEYSAAEDVFQRILGALPNDLTIHIGLSIVAKETDNLPKAIWHMQRAYELDPYNPSLQSELKKLYKQRDGRAPAKLILTQGALARLHFQGEMYETAVSEWRSMLKKEPNRLDVRVMLAETYWRQNNRAGAVELSRHLLEEAPDLIQPNAIIAEIWLLTGRVNEAQFYLQRLQELTQISEATFDGETAVCRAFLAKGAPALLTQIMVERGEDAGRVLEDVEETAVANTDWLSEVDVSGDIGGGDDSSDWFVAQAAATAALISDKADDSVGWLHDIEADNEKEESGQSWLDALTATDADELEDVSTLPETDTDAELSGWMNDDTSDSSGDTLDWFAEDETAVSDTPLAVDDELDWLDGLNSDVELADDDLFDDESAIPTAIDVSAGNDFDDKSFTDLFADTPADSNDEDDGDDDLFDGLGLSGLLADTAGAAALHDDEQDDDSLDWLSDEFEPLTEGEPVADEANDAAALDWFGDLDKDGEETAVDNTGDLPDWLNQPEESESISPAADSPDWLTASTDDEQTEAIHDESLPDWLATDASDSDNASANRDDLPDWLMDDADDELTAPIRDESLPDWLAADASERDDADANSNDLPDWLSGDLTEIEDESNDNDGNALAGIAAAGAIASGIAIAAHDHDDKTHEEREDTTMSSEDTEERGLPEELFDDMPENEEDALDWLDQLAEDQHLEPQDAIPAESKLTAIATSPAADDNLPDWLQDSPTPLGEISDSLGFDFPEEEPLTANADLPDWLQEAAADPVDDEASYASQVAAGEGDIFDEMPTQMSAPDPFADNDDFSDLFGDTDEADTADFDALFADTDDDSGVDMDDAALFSLAGTTAVSSLEDDAPSIETTDDDFGDLFADMADMGDSDEGDFADLFADMGDDDPLADFEIETDRGDEETTEDADVEEKEKFDPAGALAASALAAALAKRKKKDDIFVPPPEEEESDLFDDMFADADSVEDPLADLDMLKKDTAVSMPAFEETDDDLLSFLTDDAGDNNLDDLFGKLNAADDPLANLGDFEFEEETAIEEEADDLLGFLTDDAGDSDLDDLFGKLDAADDPLANLGDFEEETAIEEEADDLLGFLTSDAGDSDLDDLFGKLDAADDPLANLGDFEEETAVSMPTLEETADDDLLGFLTDDAGDSDLDDLFGELDESSAGMLDFLDDDIEDDTLLDEMDAIAAAEEDDRDDTGEEASTAGVTAAALMTALGDKEEEDDDNEDINILDSIIAFEKQGFEEQGIDDDLFAEAGMGDSITDSEVMDLGEGLEWLDDSIADTGELTAFDWMAEESVVEGIVPLEPLSDTLDADVVDDQISWLDELAAQQDDEPDEKEGMFDAAILAGAVAGGAIAADALADEPDEEEAIDDAMAWLDDLSDGDSEPVEQLPSIADIVDLEPETDDEYKTPFFSDMDDLLTSETLDALNLGDTSQPLEETAVNIDADDEIDDAMAWLDELDDESVAEVEVETAVDEPIVAEMPAVAEPTEPIIPVETDDIELDEELGDAMAWLDELEGAEPTDEPVVESEEPAAAALVADEVSDDEETGKDEVETPPPTRLSRALDWLEALAMTEGIALTETAVDIEVSDDDLAQALDGLDALVTHPATEAASDDELWVERSDPEMDITPEPEPEKPKEVRLDVEGKPIPEGAVETSFGAVLWADDDADLGFDLDLDFSDEMALMEGLADDEEAAAKETAVIPEPEPEPEKPKEVRLDVEGKPIPEGAVETSFGAVLWATDGKDDIDLDFDFDIPDDPDEMAAWLLGDSDGDGGTDPKVSIPTATESGEEQQAQQADAASSIPSPSFNIDLDDGVPVALPEDPDQMVAWLDDASNKQSADEFITFDTSPLDDILGEDDKPEDNERLFGEEMGLGHDLSDSMPEWLSFTSGNSEADWLSALPEADVSSWLEAEGDITDSADSDWAAVNSPRGRSSENKPAATDSTPPRNIHTDDLHLPETSMLSSSYSLDDEKLRDARHLVNTGNTQASLSAYRALIKEGDGLNIIISDLEIASQKFKNEPEICRLLGDAYTQNGQLQKALTTYRDALGMM